MKNYLVIGLSLSLVVAFNNTACNAQELKDEIRVIEQGSPNHSF
jgi:hypothetical protein